MAKFNIDALFAPDGPEDHPTIERLMAMFPKATWEKGVVSAQKILHLGPITVEDRRTKVETVFSVKPDGYSKRMRTGYCVGTGKKSGMIDLMPYETESGVSYEISTEILQDDQWITVFMELWVMKKAEFEAFTQHIALERKDLSRKQQKAYLQQMDGQQEWAERVNPFKKNRPNPQEHAASSSASSSSSPQQDANIARIATLEVEKTELKLMFSEEQKKNKDLLQERDEEIEKLKATIKEHEETIKDKDVTIRDQAGCLRWWKMMEAKAATATTDGNGEN